jgi:hypothetical protein
LVHTASGGRLHCLEVLVKLAVLIEASLVGLLTAACGGPDAVDPLASPLWQIALAPTSTDSSEVAVRSEAAALSVEEAWLSLRSFEMVPCSNDAAPISHSEYPIDLADDPPALAFETGVRDYCAVRLAIAPSRAAEPAELAELSLHVRGTRSDDIPFEIRSALDVDVELRTPSGSRFDARHLAVGFDLAVWLAEADVQGATATDGVAVIDSNENSGVLTAFETNTSLAVAVYEDADRDGLLDDDELTPVAIAE